MEKLKWEGWKLNRTNSDKIAIEGNMERIGTDRANGNSKIGDTLLMGTWNVRGTFEERALKHLSNECKGMNFDVITIQETK